MWGLPGPERAQKKVRGSLVKVENLETPTLGTSGEVILSFLPTTLNRCSSGPSEVYRALRCYPKSPLCVIYTEKGQTPRGPLGLGNEVTLCVGLPQRTQHDLLVLSSSKEQETLS